MSETPPKKPSSSYARRPKQKRSQESLEKLLNAAVVLLSEEGYKDFTLQQVSKRSGVSIGSIYCRFEGRDDLIRQVQQRESKRIDDEFALIIHGLRRKKLKLDQLLIELTKCLGYFLKENAKVMRPLMEAALHDPVVAESGKDSFGHTRDDYEHLLSERAEEMRLGDTSHGIHLCFEVAYASLARYLGLGTLEQGESEGDFDRLLGDLAKVQRCYLLDSSPE